MNIGALWVKKSKNGKNYMSGTITVNGIEKKIVVFKNNKKKDNHPDFQILESQARNDYKKNQKNRQNSFTNDSDIPF